MFSNRGQHAIEIFFGEKHFCQKKNIKVPTFLRKAIMTLVITVLIIRFTSVSTSNYCFNYQIYKCVNK